jgi:hypothetical protein
MGERATPGGSARDPSTYPRAALAGRASPSSRPENGGSNRHINVKRTNATYPFVHATANGTLYASPSAGGGALSPPRNLRLLKPTLRSLPLRDTTTVFSHGITLAASKTIYPKNTNKQSDIYAINLNL